MGRPRPEDHEKFEGSAQPITPAEMMAEFHMLGHGEIGDDEESQQFFGEVERLNAGWKPGDVPRLPAGYRSGAAYRAVLASVARPVAVEPRPREQRNGRPREQRSGRGRSRRGPPNSNDDPDPDLDPSEWPRRSDVDRVFLDALARFETLREFEEFAVRCLRKACFLFAIGWPR
jgi:hypothetical protein